MDVKRLLSEIDGLIETKAQAEGTLKQIQKSLEEEFGVSTIEDAEAKREALQEELEELERKIEEEEAALTEEVKELKRKLRDD